MVKWELGFVRNVGCEMGLMQLDWNLLAAKQ